MNNTEFNKLKNFLTKLEGIYKQFESSELSSDQKTIEAISSLEKMRSDMVLLSSKFKQNNPARKQADALIAQASDVISKFHQRKYI
jgi:protein subunit release factor A